jgi:hypothetical protein
LKLAPAVLTLNKNATHVAAGRVAAYTAMAAEIDEW